MVSPHEENLWQQKEIERLKKENQELKFQLAAFNSSSASTDARNTTIGHHATTPESQVWMQLAFHRNPLAMAVTDAHGKRLFCNPAFMQIHPCEASNELVEPFRGQWQSQQNLDALLATLSAEQEWQGELTQKGANNQVTQFKVQVSQLHCDELGEIRYLVLIQEILDHSVLEDRLRILQLATEQSPASIVITNLHGEIEYVNPKFERLTGFSAQEVMGRNPRVLKSGETPTQEYKGLWETISKGGAWHGEFHNRKKNGELYWEYAHISGIVDKSGKVTHYLAVKEDITELKALMDRLRQFHRAVEQSPVSIVITNTLGQIEYVNPKFERVTGYRAQEVLGQNPRVLKSGETPSDAYRNLWSSIFEGKEWHGEFHNRKKNGELYWEYASISPIVDDDSRILYFLAVKEDITERKLMEQSLREAYDLISDQQSHMREELEQARETQKSLMPTVLPQIPGLMIDVRYIPMERIGGDFYDIFSLDEHRYGIVVADVTGHGVSAALISFMVSGIFGDSIRNHHDTKTTMTALNELLHARIQEGKFASMFYAIYDCRDKTLQYTNAGHPAALLYRIDTEEFISLTNKGLFAGLFPNGLVDYTQETVHLQPGDRILLYTDAIYEVCNDDEEQFGTERLMQTLQNNGFHPINVILDRIEQASQEFSGKSEFDDDMTMIGLQVL